MLVVRRGGLGDTLLMLPVLAALRREHLHGELHLAGNLEFAAILQAFGAVERARSSEALHGWALRLDDETGLRARGALAGHAAVVADDPAFAAAADLVPVRCFDPRPLRDDAPLALQIGEQLGLRVSLDDAALRPRGGVVRDGPLVLAPGSGGRAKCWPRPAWEALARALAQGGRRLAVVAGPTELERDDPTRWSWPPGTAYLAGLTTVELATRLCAASAFVGNDSGPTHLAAVLGLPTVAIFGPSNAAVFAPQGPRVQVLCGSRSAPPDVPVDLVLDALARA
ncbi:MAG: glycosyltransferase family 9 protein [Planctomycetota bacterium]